MINNTNRVFSEVKRKRPTAKVRSGSGRKPQTGERVRTLEQRQVSSKALITVDKTLYDQAVKRGFYEKWREYGRK